MNMDEGGLKLRSDNHEFDMDLSFKTVSTSDMRSLLVKHLGKPTMTKGKTETWTDEENTYRVKLRRGSIDVSLDRDMSSLAEEEKLMSFAKDVFAMLGWDVNIDDL